MHQSTPTPSPAGRPATRVERNAAAHALPWLLLVLSACTSTRMDLSQNDRLYHASGYQAKASADRAVLITPVADERGPQPAEAAGPFSVELFPDSRWDRPVLDMVDAIVRDEVARSQVFAEVLERARPEACVLRVAVKRFDVGTETHVTGWRSFAAVALEVRVFGPEARDGERPLLLEKVLPGQARSEIDWRPAPAALLAGMSLRQAVGGMLAALDQSSVARSHVPLEVR